MNPGGVLGRIGVVLASAPGWAWAEAAASESVQRAAAEPMDMSNLLQVLFGLLLVLFAIVALAWLMRRLGQFHRVAGADLRVLGSLSLGQRERMVLVQVGERQLLLGVAPGRVQTLHVLDQPLRVDQEMPPSFAARLASAMRREQAS